MTTVGNSNATDIGGAGRAFTIGAAGATLNAGSAGKTWSIVTYNSPDVYPLASNGGPLTLTGVGTGFIGKAIPGNGGVTKSGSGTWILGGNNTYTGPMYVNSGTLALSNASGNNIPNSPAIKIASGATLDVTGLGGGALALGPTQVLAGQGTVNGGVTANGAAIIPGSLSSIGTLSTGNLDLSGGANLTFVLGTAGSSASSPGLGSLINVNGNLTLPSYPIAGINLLNNNNANGLGSLGSGFYDLFNYTGSLNGSPAVAFGSGTGAKVYSFSTVTGATNQLVLQLSALSVNWTGQNNGNGSANSGWDTASMNWANGSNPAAYVNGAVVNFGDTNAVTGGSIANSNVVLNSTVAPTAITFTNSAVNYTISGSGGISGATTISLQGTGLVSLQSAESLTSSVAINAGALNISNGGALGNSSGVTVAGGAALQLQGNIITGPVPLIQRRRSGRQPRRRAKQRQRQQFL